MFSEHSVLPPLSAGRGGAGDNSNLKKGGGGRQFSFVWEGLGRKGGPSFFKGGAEDICYIEKLFQLKFYYIIQHSVFFRKFFFKNSNFSVICIKELIKRPLLLYLNSWLHI